MRKINEQEEMQEDGRSAHAGMSLTTNDNPSMGAYSMLPRLCEEVCPASTFI